MNRAILSDINEDYLDAIKGYEEIIASGGVVDLEDFTNLAFIYYACAFLSIEFSFPYNIPGEISILGAERHPQIIELGLLHYPNSRELHFWKKYFPYRYLDEDFTEEDCVEIVNQYKDDNQDDNLVPYFFLHLFDETAYLKELEELHNAIERKPTAKNLYIKAFF